jgi:hypothetical protein
MKTLEKKQAGERRTGEARAVYASEPYSVQKRFALPRSMQLRHKNNSLGASSVILQFIADSERCSGPDATGEARTAFATSGPYSIQTRFALPRSMQLRHTNILLGASSVSWQFIVNSGSCDGPDAPRTAKRSIPNCFALPESMQLRHTNNLLGASSVSLQFIADSGCSEGPHVAKGTEQKSNPTRFALPELMQLRHTTNLLGASSVRLKFIADLGLFFVQDALWACALCFKGLQMPDGFSGVSRCP